MVLREKLKTPKGVCIVTQPLTSIINEKKRNYICKVAVLSMARDLKTSIDDEDDDVYDDVDLDHDFMLDNINRFKKRYQGGDINV